MISRNAPRDPRTVCAIVSDAATAVPVLTVPAFVGVIAVIAAMLGLLDQT
jgi:hypothetical protein